MNNWGLCIVLHAKLPRTPNLFLNRHDIGRGSMARFELSFLGTCAFRLDSQPIHGFASDKVRLLLAYLAVEGNRPHSREQLVEIFWSQHPPQAAHASLRSALSNLRSVLRSNPSELAVLEADRENIQLTFSQDCFLDVSAFEAHIAEAESLLAHSDDLSEAMLHFASAADLYHGNFLEGFTLKDCPEFDDWCYFVRERLLHKAANAHSRLAAYSESRCDYEQAAAYARRRIELEPWQEQAHIHLMRLLALSGQVTEALEQFQVCRQTLQDELDVEPTPETLQLYESILSGRFTQPQTTATRFTQPQTTATRFTQPPVYLTPLVGRQTELGEIAHRLQDPNCRLLSLIGPGGCGKTRLAAEAASRKIGDFADGICFVPLVATEDAAAILPALLHALGVTSPSADLQQALFGFLRQKELLLVLDNFEQLLPEGAEVLVEVLQAAPRVKLLVTSRERLHLDSEDIFLVEGMRLPTPQQEAVARSFDAVQLFLQTAQRQCGSPISDAELPEAVRICRSASGMPLAIKIAASWTRVLTYAEIASEIERSLGFLESDDRELQTRHRSVRAVFESTWRRLSSEEQAAFRKLSVFRGGFNRPAFEAVTGATLSVLTNLVDQCLLVHHLNGRYELHELLRQFAEEKLAEDAQEETLTRTAHSHFYLEFIQSLDPMGSEMADDLARSKADTDNLRTAWINAAANRDYASLEAACHPLSMFYQEMLWDNEFLTLVEEILSLLPDNPPAKCLIWLFIKKAGLLIRSGKESAGLQILAQVQELIDRHGFQDYFAYTCYLIAKTQIKDDFQESIRNLKNSIVIFQQFGERGYIAASYMWMGRVWFASGFLSKSETCFQTALGICRENQFLDFEMQSVRWLFIISLMIGNLSAAEKFFQELQGLVVRVGKSEVEAYHLCDRGLLAWRQGRLNEANVFFEQGLQRLQQCADQGKAAVLPIKTHFQLMYCQVLEAEGAYVEMQHQALQALELYRQAGFYHGWGDPWIEPLEWLACAEMHLGDYPSARQHLVKFIQDCLANRYTDWALFGLYFFAELLVKEENTPEHKRLALELLSLVLNHPRLEGIDYHPAILGKPALPTLAQEAAQLAADLPPSEAAVARERGSRLVLDKVISDLSASRGRYCP